jgi:hypothetical protein
MANRRHRWILPAGHARRKELREYRTAKVSTVGSGSDANLARPLAIAQTAEPLEQTGRLHE